MRFYNSTVEKQKADFSKFHQWYLRDLQRLKSRATDTFRFQNRCSLSRSIVAFSFRSELLRSLCILKPLAGCSPRRICSACLLVLCPRKRSYCSSDTLSADQSFDSAAFRRVTYAQRKQLPFSVPTISGAAGFNQGFARTTAILGLSYTNLNHAGLIGGQIAAHRNQH